MQQIRVVTLLARWSAEWLEALVRIVLRIEAGAPALVRKGRIGDDVVEGLERVAILELGIGNCVALHDESGWVVVQNHVHASKTASSSILFLPIEGDFGDSRIAHLEQQ